MARRQLPAQLPARRPQATWRAANCSVICVEKFKAASFGQHVNAITDTYKAAVRPAMGDRPGKAGANCAVALAA